MNYIFLLLGFDSFYESIIMSKLLDQIPVNTGIFCFTGPVQAVYFTANQRLNVIPFQNDKLENQKLFELTIKEGDISAIFIFDYYRNILSSVPDMVFDLKWLENLAIPVNIIDYLDIFGYNKDHNIFLKHSKKYYDLYKQNTEFPVDLPKLKESMGIPEVVKKKTPLELKNEMEDKLQEVSEAKAALKTPLISRLKQNVAEQEAKEEESLPDETDEQEDEEQLSEEIEEESDETEEEEQVRPNFLYDENDEKDIIPNINMYSNIIKLSPPLRAPEENNIKNTVYMDFTPQNFYDDDINLEASFGIKENSKNILLIFSYQMMIKSKISSLEAHYPLISKTLILYLKTLDIDINLFIVGSDLKSELIPGTKIQVNTFKIVNHGLYKSLMSLTDLLITDTTWHPILIDAACLNIPAGVIGNSLSLNEDGSLNSKFESTDLEVFNLIEDTVKTSPQIFFPYTSFPLKTETLPEFTYYENKFIYYLLDIYSDEVMIPFLGEFLINNEEVYNNLVKRQELYKKRAEFAVKPEHLLQLFT